MSKDNVLAELRNLVKELNKRWQIKFPKVGIVEEFFQFNGFHCKITWADVLFIERIDSNGHLVMILSQHLSLEQEDWEGLFEILPDHIEKLYDKLVEMTTLKIPDELREALNLG